MTVRVIYVLESIEIYEEDGGLAVLGLGHDDVVGQPFHQEAAVWKPGEGIVKRHLN